MARGEVVLVPCSFGKGGFPSELVFHIPAQGGELAGVAPRDYCFDRDKKPIASQLQRDETVQGYVVGLLLGNGDSSGTSRVNLPDNDVYEIPSPLLVRNGELAQIFLRPGFLPGTLRLFGAVPSGGAFRYSADGGEISASVRRGERSGRLHRH
jgi:hypothetical protein